LLFTVSHIGLPIREQSLYAKAVLSFGPFGGTIQVLFSDPAGAGPGLIALNAAVARAASSYTHYSLDPLPFLYLSKLRASMVNYHDPVTIAHEFSTYAPPPRSEDRSLIYRSLKAAVTKYWHFVGGIFM
jgi:hypothetical protein